MAVWSNQKNTAALISLQMITEYYQGYRKSFSAEESTYILDFYYYGYHATHTPSLPHPVSTISFDAFVMWIGEKSYLLSDIEGIANIIRSNENFKKAVRLYKVKNPTLFT